MDWKHPDILEFIQAKTQSTIDAGVTKSVAEQMAQLVQSDLPLEQKQQKFQEINQQLATAWVETHLSPEGKRDRRWHNANISVQLDDEFFTRLDTGDSFAQDLWDKIATNAHATADPGLLLIDNAKRRSPIRDFVTCTNPCGEIFLPPNSACNLASLVLTKFIHQNANGEIEIDWQDLAETVAISTRFLDNVLSVAEFATPDQKHNVRNVFRQLGLGIMGWADYLKQARIAYDSAQHLDEIDRWGGWIAHHAYRASEALAKEKSPCGVWPQIQEIRTGNIFERWVDSEGNQYNGEEALQSNRQDLTQVPRRNSTVLSIAPTGSIAQLAACSWAFEPDFGLTLWKQVFVDASKNEQNWIQILNPYLEELQFSEADAEIVKRTGSLKGTEFATQHPKITAAFKIAREVPPGWHILVQSKWQDWIDSSISKTINLPSHATVDEIKQIYRLAAKAGLKGVTIYRSGTLESEPIKVGDAEKSGS